MPNVGLGQYTPEIIATPCRSEKCRAGGVGERCKNQWGQHIPPHKVRKTDAKRRGGIPTSIPGEQPDEGRGCEESDEGA